MEDRDESWFLSQLQSNCQDVRFTNKDFLIVCPFHADSSPSCHVDRHSGMYHCFSCSAGGHWNKLAEEIGAEVLNVKGESLSLGDLRDSMSRSLKKAGVVAPRRSKKKGSNPRPMVSDWPINDDWRSVSGDILYKIGCVKVTDLVHSVIRIGLPIRDLENRLLGYTCRAVNPVDVNPKYTPLSASKNEWRKTELPVRESMFLLDVAMKQGWDQIVLTEGPYDALHLMAHGIPAIAILGTSSWTPEKVAMITGLGVSVAVMMDNDNSGRKAQREIIRSLKGKVKVAGVNLPKSVKDPGDLKSKHIKWLNKFFAENL